MNSRNFRSIFVFEKSSNQSSLVSKRVAVGCVHSLSRSISIRISIFYAKNSLIIATPSQGFIYGAVLISVGKPRLSISDRFQANQTTSEAVISAIADAEGISPMDVNPPLASVIDPDALDQVIASMARWSDEPAGVVEFPYNGYIVSATADGVVSVSELDI